MIEKKKIDQKISSHWNRRKWSWSKNLWPSLISKRNSYECMWTWFRTNERINWYRGGEDAIDDNVSVASFCCRRAKVESEILTSRKRCSTTTGSKRYRGVSTNPTTSKEELFVTVNKVFLKKIEASFLCVDDVAFEYYFYSH